MVNIFIWLYDKQRLKGFPLSQFYVRSLTVLTLLIQSLLTYEIVVGIDLIRICLTHFNLNRDEESCKETTCNNNFTALCSGCLVVLIVVTSLEERLIVYQGKDRSVPAKMAILVQTTLSGFIMLSSIALILVQDSRLNILMNFPALIFINEIPHYVGLHLHKFLKTHHNHLVTQEDFLKFETKPSHHAIILSFMQAHIANFCTSLVLLWAV